MPWKECPVCGGSGKTRICHPIRETLQELPQDALTVNVRTAGSGKTQKLPQNAIAITVAKIKKR